MVEKISNNATTTLSAPINGSSNPVVLTVSDPERFPTAGNFRILIDNELLLVTSVVSNAFTATRAQEGTTIAAHLAGATVTQILTAGAVTQLLNDRVGTGIHADRPTVGISNRYYIASNGVGIDVDEGAGTWASYFGLQRIKPPVLTDFTWVNQGGATATQGANCIDFNMPNSGSDQIRLLVKTASTSPIDYTIAVTAMLNNSIYNSTGLFVYNSVDGKVISWMYEANLDCVSMKRWSSVTTFASDPYGSRRPRAFGSGLMYLRYREDSTNRYFMASIDNTNWITYITETKATHMTVDKIGFGCQMNGNDTLPGFAKFVHFQER